MTDAQTSRPAVKRTGSAPTSVPAQLQQQLLANAARLFEVHCDAVGKMGAGEEGEGHPHVRREPYS